MTTILNHSFNTREFQTDQMKMFTQMTWLGCLLLGYLNLSAFAAPLMADSSAVNPELMSGYFQGDMNIVLKRNGLLSINEHWPNATVYYDIVGFDAPHVDFIKSAMQTVEDASCVRFLPADEKTQNLVQINVSDNGCWSNVGYNGGIQHLGLVPSELNTGCFRVGTIQHELLHTLGFSHQHSASERDNYIGIVWHNIKPNALQNFQKLNSTTSANYGVEYDYGSVMHYPKTAFSRFNGSVTIEALKPLNGAEMGQRNGMSLADITRLNNMYKCYGVSDQM